MRPLTAAAKKITADWHSYFAEFDVWKPRDLVRRHGVFITGILLERDRSNDNYQPLSYAHCLVTRDYVGLMARTKLRRAPGACAHTDAIGHRTASEHGRPSRPSAEAPDVISRGV